MNIPENILQQVADAAFLSSNGGMMGLLTCNKEKNHVFWHEERYERRDVIQHAISNPALAPYLNVLQAWPPVGEYTDSDIVVARHMTSRNIVEDKSFPGMKWLRAFLASLPRRESSALDDLKSDLDGWKDRAVSLEGQVNEAIARAEKAEAELSGLLEAANEESRKDHVKYSQLANKLEGAQAELAALKSAELGILRLPAAEATPQAEPAAQVPLGPEDCPPGSVFTFGAKALWITPLCVSSDGVGFPETEPNNPLIQKFSFELLQEAAKINTSLPDTGRWDANAWRPCSKPGKEVAK